MRTRLRAGLGRRLLLGLAAAAVYAIAALALAALVPETGWPPIGDGRYSAAQAAIVPALNLFGLAVLLLAVAAPAIPRAAQIALALAAAVVAAAAGPLLALTETGTASAILTAGTIGLALSGAAVGTAWIWTAGHWASPAH